MTLTMYDAIPEDFPNVPDNPPAIASYIDNFGGYTEAVKRWPDAHHLSITTFGGRARAADMEAGAMRLSAFPAWYHEEAIHDEGLPIAYTSASNLAELIRGNAAAGIPRSAYLIWSAHYDGEHICGPDTCGFPQADGTQWDDLVDFKPCDVSKLGDRFFNPAIKSKRAHGLAVMELQFDLARRHWRIHQEHPEVVELGPVDQWASAEVQYNVRTGQCRVKPLAWNARPLG